MDINIKRVHKWRKTGNGFRDARTKNLLLRAAKADKLQTMAKKITKKAKKSPKNESLEYFEHLYELLPKEERDRAIGHDLLRSITKQKVKKAITSLSWITDFEAVWPRAIGQSLATLSRTPYNLQSEKEKFEYLISHHSTNDAYGFISRIDDILLDNLYSVAYSALVIE